MPLPASFDLLWGRMTPGDKRRFSGMTLLAIFNGMLDLAGVAALFMVIAALIEPSSNAGTFFNDLIINLFGVGANPYLIFILPALFLTLLFIVKNLLAVLISNIQVRISFEINKSISDDLIASHLWSDARHHRMEHSTASVNRISTVSLYLADTLIIASLTLFAELFVALLVLLFAAFSWPGMFLYLVISIIPVAVLILFYNRKKLKAFGRENNRLIPEVYHIITDSIFGYEEIRLSNTEDRFLRKLQHLRDRIYENRKRIIILSDHYHFRILETLVVASLLIITFLAIWQSTPGDLTIILALYSAIAFRLIPSVSRIVGSFNSLSAYHYIAEMLTETKPVRQKDEESQATLPDLSRDIRIEQLYFSFNDDQEVLKQIDLTLSKGQTIGIHGPSGAGKTTLLNLIMGFYLPSSGAIRVDDQLLTENTIRSWQAQVAYVRQNAFLLSGTIAENVAFGLDHAEIDLLAVHTCLKKVGLWSWVDSLPNGPATRVGELGNAISGGQRQRMAIARAIFKNANVFIFDEPTTSLDDRSAREVIDAIFSLESKDSILIIVSHDSRIMARTQRQLRLFDGQISEENLQKN